MSKEPKTIVEALQQTAQRIDSGARYEWGHMGRCNCGHLVQTLTGMTDTKIAAAVNHEIDEWSEHAKDYCSQTGHPVDELFRILEDVGFSHQDVVSLERLTDRRVLRELGDRGQNLRRNHPPDVSLYMRTLAEVMDREEQLVHA